MYKIFKKKNLFIAASIVLSIIIGNTFTVGANDRAILSRLNELTGYNFTSNHQLTREETCVAISKIFLSKNTIDRNILPFEDIDKIKPESIAYLSILYRDNILFGAEKNEGIYMMPNENLTRQEAVVFLGRALSKSSDYAFEFTDSHEIADWAKGYIAWFVENDIISGYPDGSFSPGKYITAGEFSILAMKALDFKALNSAEISTIFGTGTQGFTNGDLIAARFALPYSIVMDNSNLIVLDTYNNALRKTQGDTATAIAGNIVGFDNEGFPKGYYLDGKLSEALLNRPTDGVVSSKGQLFIADSANNVIRFIVGDKMFTFSGTTQGYKDGADDVAQYNRPTALAIDKNDNIYVADTLNNCIRKIDIEGNVTTIAGAPQQEGLKDGDAKSALFREPSGIAIGNDGAIYVADTGNHAIRKILNGTVTTIAGTTAEVDEEGSPIGGFKDGVSNMAMFNLPRGLTMAGDILIIADSANNRIRALSPSGSVFTIIGNGEPGDTDGNALEAMLHHPMGVYFKDETLYIADTSNNKIKAMTFNPSSLN